MIDQRIALQRVQHVSLPRPRGSDETTRRFYGEILGLEEVAAPATIAHLDLIWFRIGDNELHLFASDEGPRTSGQHLCLQTDDVGALRDHLVASGVEIEETTPIPNRPRFFCRDPFGNLIEFTSIQGAYA